MANYQAISTGNWSSTSTWAGGAVPPNGAGHNIYTNNFTVTIDTNIDVALLTNAGITGTTFVGGATSATVGGTFNLNDGITVTSTSIVGPTAGSSAATVLYAGTTSSTIVSVTITAGSINGQHTIRSSSTGTLNITGNCNGIGSSGQAAHAVYLSGTGTINITGNLVGGVGTVGIDSLGGTAVVNKSTGTIVINGNVTGGTSSASKGIVNFSTGSVTVYGNLNATIADVALSNASTGSVTIYGNLNGSTAAGLSNTSTGSVTVLGNITADSRGGNGITSSNGSANVRISGNLIGAPNGIPAVYAASYTVNPVPYQTYIRYANNGTGVGSDAYLYHYTTDSLSAFSIPPVSAVRAGLQYANNTLTGTCVIPAASAVTFGALVDNITGTAAITSNTLFDVSVASLTATNSLGERLKNSATVESVGKIIASFSN